LNYGHFIYSDLQVTSDRLTERDTLEVRVQITNDGARAAQETVFLFTHDLLACVARPLLELKGFGKISLQPGQSGCVTVRLPATELRFFSSRPDQRVRTGRHRDSGRPECRPGAAPGAHDPSDCRVSRAPDPPRVLGFRRAIAIVVGTIIGRGMDRYAMIGDLSYSQRSFLPNTGWSCRT